MIGFCDLHCDTITKSYEKNKSLFENDLHIDIKRMLSSKTYIQFFAVWLSKKYLSSPLKNTLTFIDYFHSQILQYKNFVAMPLNYNDVIKNLMDNKINCFLSIEGGSVLEGKIDNLKILYERGVRLITLTWNYDNEISGGSFSSKGLSNFGKDVVKNMEELGIIVDVSHLSDQGFFDLCALSTRPFVATHSNARKICDSKRNLTDEQIKMISLHGGIIGLNLYPEFLNSNQSAELVDVIKHIEHIIKIGGENCLAFGCDFDGVEKLPNNIRGLEDIQKIYDLVQKEFGNQILHKISYQNVFNFIRSYYGK